MLFPGICSGLFPSFFSYLNIILEWWLMAGNRAALFKSQKAYVGQQGMYRMSCKFECNELHTGNAYTHKHSPVLKWNTVSWDEKTKKKKSKKKRWSREKSSRKEWHQLGKIWICHLWEIYYFASGNCFLSCLQVQKLDCQVWVMCKFWFKINK